MHVVTWESPAEMVAYGPFMDGVEAGQWYQRRTVFADMSVNRAVMYPVLSPVEYASAEESKDAPGKVYHHGVHADDRALGWVVTVVVEEAVVVSFGVFDSRSGGEMWFLTNRAALNGHPALVLPLLSPGGE